jgi:hypothetical protein
VCPRKNVTMEGDAIVEQTVIAVSVSQIFVKVSKVICYVKNLSFSVVVPTCNDTVENANETDVDCGGTCLPTKRCGERSRCIHPSDCTTGVCVSNICQGECGY